MISIDIFYKSYSKDFKLLQYSLKSLAKNVTGYNNIVLLIPEHEKGLFDTRDLPERTLIHYVREYGSGYLFQQWCKISAHKYSNAEFILFADSDCIFTYPINVQDYVSDGKPEILYTDYDKVGTGIIWKKPTEDFIKQPVQYEMMRRNCLIYHRSTLEAIEKYDPNLEYVIMNSERFSEFNCMSVFAWTYERDKYNFVNTDGWQYTPPKAEQLWSWCVTGNSDEHERETKRALEVINKALDLNLTEL